MDLDNNSSDCDMLLQNSSQTHSDNDISIHKKIPAYQNKEKNMMNASSPTASKSSDDKESCSSESTSYWSTTVSSQDLSSFSSDEEIFNSPEKSSLSNQNTFDEIYFGQIGSEEKIAEFKVSLSRVNDAFINWKINEFVLDTIKTKCTSWKWQIMTVTKSSEIQNNIYLKNENGEITIPLGLEEEDIRPPNSQIYSKSSLFFHAVDILSANVAKLKLQKQSLKDDFGAHSIKTMDGVMSGERKEQLELYQHLEDEKNQVYKLLGSSHTAAEQLATLRYNSAQHFEAAAFKLLQSKAMYLHTVMSIVKEKSDSFLDENMKIKMDTEGVGLTVQVAEMKEELKCLQKTLTEYEKKEAESAKYRDIAAEYRNVKRQLEHKYQTLSILSGTDMDP